MNRNLTTTQLCEMSADEFVEYVANDLYQYLHPMLDDLYNHGKLKITGQRIIEDINDFVSNSIKVWFNE